MDLFVRHPVGADGWPGHGPAAEPALIDSLTVSWGSVGAVIVLLMWLYLSGITVLVGAEVNSII